MKRWGKGECEVKIRDSGREAEHVASGDGYMLTRAMRAGGER